MFAGIARVVIGLIVVIAICSAFAAPLAIEIAAVVVVLVLVTGWNWYVGKTFVYTAKQLTSKPFNGKLPLELGKATETAVALAGDDSYSQKIVGEKAFGDNFEDLRQYADYPDGSMLEVQCALVAEPANPHSTHAVAVTCGGVVLGYIAEFESEPLFKFLMNNRGMARVNSNVYFSIADGFSHVELDLTRPYEIVKGV
ncbi:MAG: hypothetical protein RL556_341 [Actinomycetota bacterium]|jgi:hypothetical protein